MAEELLTCPACKSTLRLAQEVPEGRKVKCPKCGIHFSPGEELVDEGVVAEESPLRSRPRDDDDYDDRPRRRHRDDDYDDRPRRRQREKPRSLVATLLILAAVIVVPLLAIGALYGVYRGLSTPDKGFKLPENAQAPPQANNNAPPPDQGQKDQNNNQPPKKAGPGEVGLDIGNKAPEIEGEDLDGKKFKLSDYRGKVVVLDFWGNW